MEPTLPLPDQSRRPIPSLFVGFILLLTGAALLLTDLLAPASLQTIAVLDIPFATQLLFLLCGAYLLACLISSTPQRILFQRICALALITGAILLLYLDATHPSAPYKIELPATSSLIAFLIAGVAALINPAVRTLGHLVSVFLLILLVATIAIFAITAYSIDYELLFSWNSNAQMSPMTAIALLLYAFGFSYSSWWCHRKRRFNPVRGITLISSLLLIFATLVGAGIIYAAAASFLHNEVRYDLTYLINDRSSRVLEILRHNRELAQLISEDALHDSRQAALYQLNSDYALKVSDSGGHLITARNADWFTQKTQSAIISEKSTLWRGEEGPCQLRLVKKSNLKQVEISIPLDLSPALQTKSYHYDSEVLLLCGHLPDRSLTCLTPRDTPVYEIPEVLKRYAATTSDINSSDKLFINKDSIEAIMPIPEFGLIAYMSKNEARSFEPLFQRMYIVMPLALILLAASIGFIAWRIHPLATQLHRSEHRYRTLVDGAADGIFLHDQERRFIEVNPAASALLGYSREELIGMHPEDLLLPNDYEDARLQLMHLNAPGETLKTRRQLRRKSGEIVDVEIRATRLDTGKLISVVRDISEQVEQEAALRSKERFITSVVEVLAEGVIVYQQDGRVIYTNRAAHRLLGVNDIRAVDKLFLSTDYSAIRENITPFTQEELPAYRSLYQGICERNVIMGITRPDGQRIWFSVNSDPLLNEESNTIQGAVVSFSDITQKRETENAFFLSRERLRALSNHLLQVREEEKSMIAREIHDELGSSLTAIKMGIEWLDAQIPHQQKQLSDRLERLTKVTAQAIQSTRRIVSQLRPSVLEDLGLWPALEWLIQEFGSHSNIEISYNLNASTIEPTPHTALAIYRVIQEALNNVAKHAKASKVHLECWYSDEQLHITIEDDGVGIEDDEVLDINAYGIRGMYERIGQLNGKLQILGSPSEGTLIAMTIPYNAQMELAPND